MSITIQPSLIPSHFSVFDYAQNFHVQLATNYTLNDSNKELCHVALLDGYEEKIQPRKVSVQTHLGTRRPLT